MPDDAGNLSIDFLAGFTIFMIVFIYVATLIPGLFINLQSWTVDYDAVAYRTGVILVEDPGMPTNPSWETLSDYNKGNILRFGLALTQDTPNILSLNKIDRFFCSTSFAYPADYRSRAVFGDYPYQFNISLQMVGDNSTQSIGDIPPAEYGYSRRIVKIKEESNATIGAAQIAQHPGEYQSEQNVTVHPFSVFFNYTELSEYGPNNNNPAYQINPIDPLGEGVIINLTELANTTNPNMPQPQINLSQISIYRSVAIAPLYTSHSAFAGPLLNSTDASQFGLYIDGNNTPVTTLPVNVNSSVSLFIPPNLLSAMGNDDPSTWLKITMQFDLSQGDWFLNSTNSNTRSGQFGAFEYNYSPAQVTQPVLRDGVMEVAVW
jgi:hypothetical protein